MIKQPIGRFEALVARPIAWEQVAANHIAAANHLYEVDRVPAGDSTISDGSNWLVMLLDATAAENLLKVIRIAQGDPASAGGKLARYYSNHGLVNDATDAGVSLGPEERRVTEPRQQMLKAG